MTMPLPLVSFALPALATELEKALAVEGRPELAAQIATLRIVDRCRCEDTFCGSFYTVPKPKAAWGPGHETIPLSHGSEGMVNVDVLQGRIVHVEVLFRDAIREALQKVCP